MNIILSILFPIMDSAWPILQDVAVWPILLIGGAIILGIGAVIVILIIVSVKFLRRLRDKNANNDRIP